MALLAGCGLRQETFRIDDVGIGQAKLVTSQPYPWATAQTILIYNVVGLQVVEPLSPDVSASANLGSLASSLANHVTIGFPF